MDQMMNQKTYLAQEPVKYETESVIDQTPVVTLDSVAQKCRNLKNCINTLPGTLLNIEDELNRVQSVYPKQANRDIYLHQLWEQASSTRVGLHVKVQKLIETINQGRQLLEQDDLNRRLHIWRVNQKTEQIGSAFDGKEAELDSIYSEFDELPARVSELQKVAQWAIEKLREYPIYNGQALEDSLTETIQYLGQHTNELGQYHLLPTVSKQPEPVLKTKAKINPIEVHFLGADKSGLKRKLVGAQVTVDIVTENVARLLAAGEMDPTNVEPVGTIANQVQMATLNEKQQVIVNFNDCKLEKVARRTKGATIEQKYVLLFRCIPLDDDAVVWTLSLPVMVTVHGSQDCDLCSEIFWLRAFGSVDYNGENNNDTSAVQWPTLSEAIIGQFAIRTGATFPLSEGAMAYMAEKMFGPATSADPERKQTLVTYERFAKNSMYAGVKFSCWDYIFCIMQLLVKQKEVLEFWNNGWIFGFISKEEAAKKINSVIAEENKLTFLLRFSDSQLGAVSIVYVAETIRLGGHRIDHLNPFTISDLNQMSLKQRIWGCNQLQNTKYLYPNVNKQDVIANVTQTPFLPGYVRASVILVVGTNERKVVSEAPPTNECRHIASCSSSQKASRNQSGAGNGCSNPTTPSKKRRLERLSSDSQPGSTIDKETYNQQRNDSNSFANPPFHRHNESDVLHMRQIGGFPNISCFLNSSAHLPTLAVADVEAVLGC